MMDQKRGKFLIVDDNDLDTSVSAPSSPAPVRPKKVLPTLAEGEVVDFGEFGQATVVKIKPNGKLFMQTAPATAFNFGTGGVTDIKGVKFRVVRVNERGQIGLRMMNAIEVAAWEAKPKGAISISLTVDLNEKPKEEPVAVTLTNPSSSKKGFHVSTDAQIKRAEQKERRQQALAERREKNRAIAEREREVSKNTAVPGMSKNKINQQFGAEQAAKRKRARKLAPMLAAQEAARQRAESEKRSRKEKTPAAVVSLVVAGAA